MTMMPLGMAPPASVAPSGMNIPPEATRIISLLEAVTLDELLNDEDYNDIMEDMRDECSKVGPPRALRACFDSSFSGPSPCV